MATPDVELTLSSTFAVWNCESQVVVVWIILVSQSWDSWPPWWHWYISYIILGTHKLLFVPSRNIWTGGNSCCLAEDVGVFLLFPILYYIIGSVLLRNIDLFCLLLINDTWFYLVKSSCVKYYMVLSGKIGLLCIELPRTWNSRME